MIQKRSDMQGIDISKYKISNIYNWKRKNRQLLLLHGMKIPKKKNVRKRYVLFQIFIMKTLVTRENLSVLKSVAKPLNTSVQK